MEVQLSAVEEPATYSYEHVATELSTSVQKPAEEVESPGVRTQLTVSLATAGGGRGDERRGGGQIPLPTTLEDFEGPGTQANSNPNEFARVISSVNCSFCHGDYEIETAPYDTWVVSLMAQSARDPVFHAAFTIANQDADNAEHLYVMGVCAVTSLSADRGSHPTASLGEPRPTRGIIRAGDPMRGKERKR